MTLDGGLPCKVVSIPSLGQCRQRLDNSLEGFLSWDVVRGMTFKVSWDAEGLGFLESGNSLTPAWGIRKPWPLAWGVGTDTQGPSLCQYLGNRETEASLRLPRPVPLPGTHPSAAHQVCLQLLPAQVLRSSDSVSLACWLTPQGLDWLGGLWDTGWQQCLWMGVSP